MANAHFVSQTLKPASIPAPELVDLVRRAIEAEAETYELVHANELGGRNEMFTYAQHIQAAEEFAGVDDRAAVQISRMYLRMIYRKQRDPWQAAFPQYDDPQTSLRKIWNVIAFPKGRFKRALRLANSARFKITLSGQSELYCRFLSLCRALQHLAGEGVSIFVPKRGVFAEALGVSPRTISTYCQVAQDDGYLELLKPGSLRFRLADEFVFHFPPSADAGAPSAGEVPNTFAESTTCGIATSHRVSTSHKVLANCKTAPPNK